MRRLVSWRHPVVVSLSNHDPARPFASRASYEAIARAVADNVERLRRGEPLRNRAV